MATINLSTPVYDGAIHGISFFNGRLLSGDDLAAEQKANRDGRRLLGKVTGDGVAYGLEVTRKANASLTEPLVTIQPGLAINAEGQALLLEHPIDISLYYLEEVANTLFTGFAVCGGESTEIKKPTDFTGSGDRVYVLMISSAEVSIGRAPVSGLGNIDAACNARYNVEGVMFKLLPLGVQTADYTPLHKLRNRVAARCLQAPDRGRDPFGVVPQPQNLLDILRTNSDPMLRIKPCDVPLAAVYLENSGRVRFIDTWSVRRRVAGPPQGIRWDIQPKKDAERLVQGNPWESLMGDRLTARGEARYLQFQEHVQNLIVFQQDENFPPTSGNSIPIVPNQIIADQRFEELPPVGILPITTTGISLITGTSSTSGFSWKTFFGALAPDALDMTDSSILPRLLHESFMHQPTRIGSSAEAPLRLYLIRENVDAVNAKSAAQLALVFASRTLPYAGIARYDYAHFDVGHYA